MRMDGPFRCLFLTGFLAARPALHRSMRVVYSCDDSRLTTLLFTISPALLPPSCRLSAARNGHTECVKALLEFGADPDKGFAVGPFGILAHANPLVHAAANGHAEAVEALIAAGAAPAGVYPWSHLDPARGCMQPETSDEGENGGGKVEKHNKLKRQTSIVHVIDENTGLVRAAQRSSAAAALRAPRSAFPPGGVHRASMTLASPPPFPLHRPSPLRLAPSSRR